VAYIRESSSNWQRRRRRRGRITLLVVLVLLVGAGGVGYAVWSGRLKPGAGASAPAAVLPLCPATTKKAPLTASAVKVNVYNATTRDGLASSTAAALRARSFQIGAIANDPQRATVPGPALVRFGPAGAAGAKLVAAQVGGAKLVQDARRDAGVDLVAGTTFTALLPPTKNAVTPKSSPSPCRPPTPKPSTTKKPGGMPTGKNVSPPPTTPAR
jgi:hypothetical protein